MLEQVKTIVSRLNTSAAAEVANAWPRGQTSVGGDGEATDETAADGSEAGGSPDLYRCRSCDQVYVATDKRSCSTCDIAVDRIEQTT